MTILESLKLNTEKLKDFSATPRLDAEALLCFVLQKEKEFLYTYPKTKLNLSQSGRLNTAIKKRIKGAPIAHIVGHKEFYGYDFFVNENVLVPRPETELMVEAVLQQFSNTATTLPRPAGEGWGEGFVVNNELQIIDVGTGSGCIPIAIANELAKINKLDDVKITAIDISSKALFVARKNAKKYNLDKKITFIEGNLLKPLVRNSHAPHPDPLPRGDGVLIDNLQQRLIITANLPYLTPEQVKNSPTIQQEPVLALVAGIDGLQYYRELFDQISTFSGAVKYTVLCEIDPSQVENTKRLIGEKLGEASVEIQKDLAGLERLVIIMKS